MLINEGLPNFLVRHSRQRYPLATMTTGILGMAFKGESDDPRESLSYKLRKVLVYESARCLCTDEYIADPEFLPAEEVVRQADLLFVGTPHNAYRDLEIPESKPVIDVWNLRRRGVFPT
jgi:UDP-N-acetyl-D-mannosaminuronic acid dehydrogenase